MKVELRSLPTSKSMTQRALVIAALSSGPTQIVRPLRCDDSRYLGAALEQLGCQLQWHDEILEVTPAPLHVPTGRLFCGNAGTAMRFASCLSLLCEGALTMDGDEHMRGRPIGALGNALEKLGVDVGYQERDGYPPMVLERSGTQRAQTTIDTSQSSQYASGLLMVAPRLDHGLRLTLEGATVSQPYLDMTLSMMGAAGAEVRRRGDRLIEVAAGSYQGGVREMEADWSAAAFFLAAEQLTGLELELVGLPAAANSLQGDAAFVDMLATLADPAQEPTFDLSETPDLIAPLAAVCIFANRPSKIRGAAHTRFKETDRVRVLCRELEKLGAQFVERHDGMDIAPITDRPAAARQSPTLDPDDDHRMAMAFGVLSLRVPGIEVLNPSCVNKSFPDFWRLLSSLASAYKATIGST